MSRSTRAHRIAGSATIFLLVIAAYWPIISKPSAFLWDDDRYVSDNPLLKDVSGLFKTWFSKDAPSQYFPLTYTTFWFEYRLWGLSPQGYHVTNLILHAVNALLIWRVLAALRVPGAWLAAAIFAVHPVNVESVAWISERKNVLCGALYWSALLAWIAFIDRDDCDQHRRRAYLSALALFVLALFAKTTACTLPAALVIAVWMRGQRMTGRRWAQVAPFVLWGLVMGIVTVWWEHVHQRTSGVLLDYPIIDRLIVASQAIWFYLEKLIIPVDLSFSYPAWTIDSRNIADYLALIACGVAALVLFFLRRRTPAIVMGILFFLASHLPTLGFIPLYTFIYTFVADHYQYLACVGILAVIAAGIVKLGARGNLARGVSITVAAAIIAVLLILTLRQTRVYRDPGTLWSDVLSKNPGSWMAQNNLGLWYQQNGKLDEAWRRYEASIAMRPDNGSAYLNLASIATARQDVAAALIILRRGIAQAPSDAALHAEIGNVLAREGKSDEAIASFRRALELYPDYYEVMLQLASLLSQRGESDEAAALYHRVLKANPDLVAARENLGNLYTRTNQLDRAIEQYRLALQTEPRRESAWNSLGVALAMDRRMDDAEVAWEEALRIDPDYVGAHINWGLSLMQRQRLGEAENHLRRALEIEPDLSIARDALEKVQRQREGASSTTSAPAR